MIVKNEAHIIIQTLENLSKYITFDYWVIGDNGSTDGTQDLIRNFFKQRNISGELYQDEWVDFGHNRTTAIRTAYNKTDYVFIFDADDSIQGNLIIPNKLTEDNYLFTFGHPSTTQYSRSLLVNNRRKWKWVGVLHEYITLDDDKPSTTKPLTGNYYVVSGRIGSRNNDPEKYLKDAKILEKGYHKAITEKDSISDRYVFYCAQSYKDANRPEEAIEWYIKTLDANGWIEERYYSCLMIYDMCCKINQLEKGIYYLVKAIKYSNRRVEAIKVLIQHYLCLNLPQVSFTYYQLIQNYVENEVLNDNLSTKLFANSIDYYFNLPYFMIIVSENLKKYDLGIKMFHIIFQKKVVAGEWWMNNIIFNLQFFVDKVNKNEYPHFFKQLEEYIVVMRNEKYQLNNELLLKYSNYGLDVTPFNLIAPVTTTSIKESNKILIFAGYGNILWNDTYYLTNSLGGSETAVVNIARCLPKKYQIYVAGNVSEETIDNITYVHNYKLNDLIKNNHFDTIIVSRYISFMESYPTFSTNKLFVWAHDTVLSSYGCNTTDKNILLKWNDRIDGIVCLTEWHQNHFEVQYPELKGKIQLINNGLNLSIFPNTAEKIPHSFVYSSCSERGLDVVLDLWPKILEKWSDAKLFISSYNNFPQNENEYKMNAIIQQHSSSITHLGKLSQKDLYDRMSITEFWLYPTSWPETSCITALEMLKNRVICLYYPYAGLVNTLGEYGIQIQRGNELEILFSLTPDRKRYIRDRGEKYAISCSWQNRANVWTTSVIEKSIKEYKNITSNTETNNTSSNALSNSNTNTTFPIEKYSDKPIVCIYHEPLYPIQILVDYLRGFNMNQKYHLLCTPDIEIVKKASPYRIIMINTLFDENIMNIFSDKTIEILNTLPLNYSFRIDTLRDFQKKYSNLKICDISISNIKLLNDAGLTDITHIPVAFNHIENEYLYKLNTTTPKVYDFGIIISSKSQLVSMPIHPPRRNKIVQYLLDNNFSVNIIGGFGIERDKEIAKCNFILNIHGQLYDESEPPTQRINRIFEHLRCDRLLNAKYNVLSEDSDYLENDFINKYSNLTICKYDDIMDINFLNNILKNNSNKISTITKTTNHNSIPTNTNIFDELNNTIRIINNSLNGDNFGETFSDDKMNEYLNNKPTWVIFYGPVFGIKAMTDYFRALNQNNEYNIIATRDIDLVQKFKPSRIMCTHQIFNPYIIDKYGEDVVELLNTEPLSYNFRLNDLMNDMKRYPKLKVYDYSRSNITILQNNNIYNVQYLPYPNNVKESVALNNLYRTTEKTYDFGIMVSGTSLNPSLPIDPPRRNKVVTYLMEHFKVNIICAWGLERDRELAKCKIILNVHGQLQQEIDPPLERTTRIFEHIRCNRLLNARFNILSEDCDYLEDELVQNYKTIRFCKYNEFFDINFMKHLIDNYKSINTHFEINTSSTNEDIIEIETTSSETSINQDYQDTTEIVEHYLDEHVSNIYCHKPNETNNYVFIHSCNMEQNGISILKKICSLIRTSGLLNCVNKVCVLNIGNPISDNYITELGDKYYVINYSDEVSLAELPTLRLMHRFAIVKPHCNMLYIHTKGVSYNKNTPRYRNVQDWTNLMLYFLIEKYKNCVENLKNNDTVGCDYYDRNDGIPKHFSGNFWWATSSYIKTLDVNQLNTRNDAEMWVCRNNPSFVECHHSTVDHYMSPYPRKQYVDKTSFERRKVVDGFIFYNEIELLKYRLRILNDYVDYFIIAEATHTHIGKEKPLNFQENIEHFTEYRDKIIYVVVDDFPHKYPNCDINKGEQWVNEKFQRCAIKRGIEQLNLCPDDILLINDLDEIPDPRMIVKAVNNEIEVTWNILEMDFYYYNLNTQLDHKWWQSKILTYGEMCEKDLTCDEVRFGNWLPIIPKAGWHLSYFGDANFISNKLQNFTHQEHNTTDMVDIDNIANKIKQHKHLFSDNVQCIHIKTKDNTYMPPMYDIYLRNFYE